MSENNIMKKIILAVIMLQVFAVQAQKYTQVNTSEVTIQWEGTSFSSLNSFVDNISLAPQLSVFAEQCKENKIDKLISDQEMVSIFVTTNQAFDKLSKRDRKKFLEKNNFSTWMKRFVVPGRLDYATLKKEAQKKNGIVYMATLHGETLGVLWQDNNLYLIDASQNKAKIVESNFYHKNGFFHLIDTVLYKE